MAACCWLALGLLPGWGLVPAGVRLKINIDPGGDDNDLRPDRSVLIIPSLLFKLSRNTHQSPLFQLFGFGLSDLSPDLHIEKTGFALPLAGGLVFPLLIISNAETCQSCTVFCKLKLPPEVLEPSPTVLQTGALPFTL